MIMFLHNGKPLSSLDLLFLGERMFGERKVLTFFMHSERNQVEYSQTEPGNSLSRWRPGLDVLRPEYSTKLCSLWKFFYFSEPSLLTCKMKGSDS